MSELRIFGAGDGQVTGSASELTTNGGGHILIDFGMSQGEGGDDRRNRTLNGLDPSKLDAIVVTHGHLDHVGKLPLLAYNSSAPIYMTPATHELAQITLKNSAQLSPWLYPNGSVDALLKRITPVPYDSLVNVDHASVTFRDAGHILGSSIVEIQEKGGDRIVFSGDLGNTPSRIVKPTKLIDGADVVVMETTYGDRNHSEDSPVDVIKDAVESIKKNKGTLLIPTFAIDRTQVVLNILKELSNQGTLKNVSVFLDTPMGSKVTDVYDSHHHLLSDGANERKDPFGFPQLTRVNSNKESDAIHYRSGAKVIISAAGMMAGGRVLKHAEHYLQDENSVLLLVGYAAEDTPARRIMEGEKELMVDEYHILVKGKVISTSSMSAHADQSQLLDWLRVPRVGTKRLRSVVLVHGNNAAREAFADKVRTELEIDDVITPKNGEVIDFSQNAR